METPHKALPGIALALPTGQQVPGERAGAWGEAGKSQKEQAGKRKI